jgi:hypothetical protein
MLVRDWSSLFWSFFVCNGSWSEWSINLVEIQLCCSSIHSKRRNGSTVTIAVLMAFWYTR